MTSHTRYPQLAEMLQGPNEPCHLLLERAQCPDFLRFPLGVEGVEIPVPGVEDEQARRLMPVLMAWPGDDSSHRWLFRHSVQWAVEHHAATWLQSALPLQDLAMALGRRMDARLDDGTEAMLRLADARTLPSIHACLDDDQRSMVFAPVSAWWYLDRQEQLRALPIEAPSSKGSAKLPVTLRPAQLSALMEAAEPDFVLQKLAEFSPKALAGLPRADRHQWTVDRVAQARQWGMEATLDLARFCSIALEQGEGFFERHAWLNAVKRVQSGQQAWAEVFLGSEIWAAT